MQQQITTLIIRCWLLSGLLSQAKASQGGRVARIAVVVDDDVAVVVVGHRRGRKSVHR